MYQHDENKCGSSKHSEKSCPSAAVQEGEPLFSTSACSVTQEKCSGSEKKECSIESKKESKCTSDTEKSFKGSDDETPHWNSQKKCARDDNTSCFTDDYKYCGNKRNKNNAGCWAIIFLIIIIIILLIGWALYQVMTSVTLTINLLVLTN